MQVRVVDYRAADAAEAFTRSLHETGFGVLVNHPIQQALVEKIYADWLAFFNTEEKHQFTFSKEKQDGYFSTEISETAKGASQKDIKEYFHIYPWGRVPASLKADADSYYAQANTLAQELLGWVERYTPPEIAQHYSQPLSQMIQDSQQTLLRVLRYPPLTGQEPAGSLRAAAHGDINLLTILPAANEPGLQVQDMNGHWIDVPCDFGMLIINIGDMLQEASRGYYPSTQHRVVNPTGEGAKKSRISLPLFLHPRNEVVLSERYTAHSYLQERLRELGVKT
ncbi:2OG-Fe(II) oxygenase [Paucibacter aquatile]|uniref:2-oxoglutarate-dependent ethylene/succinate-forming enzyme n=1 Tax=Kinneretia aquatilis TaxID=2070761 RepID=A0A2N8KVP8_9BURK|nr:MULTISPECIES: 2OG-Fe(II) oxygenase family protein [Roseateles]PND37533.1 2OG-Fe(II) oxygenase [Paucibacter aquatile]WIV96467.1 2OG-Fe(II) oxygenase family protein [Paucibacter aquatile]